MLHALAPFRPSETAAAGRRILTSGPGEFDLSAAWYRKAQGDLQAFLEGFATRMEGAIPGHVTVERRRDGLFSNTRHVAKVAIDTGPNVYTVALESNHLSALRSKAVRGVTLKSEPLDFPDWLAALNADIQRLAERTGAAHDVLHDFLMS
jgi:hypothetical protein